MILMNTNRFVFVLSFCLSLLSFNTLLGQCPGSLSCDGAEGYCDLGQLNGFMCMNPAIPNSAFPLANLCNGTGVPHNLGWWAFVGAGGPLQLEFNLDLGACRDGQGIQAGVFEGNCAGTRVWDCNANCNVGNFVLAGNTVACEIYYLWVDGCNSDVCTYTLNVAGNTNANNVLPTPLPPLNWSGNPCECGEVEICFPNLPGDCMPVISWTVNGNPYGMQGDQCITYEMGNMPINVQAKATVGNPLNPNFICQQAETAVLTITPTPPEIHMGNLKTICPKEDPYIWQGMEITRSCINPPCSARVQLPNGCCVDSLQPIQILPPEVKFGLQTIVCNEDAPFDWHGQSIGVSCVNPPCTARLVGPDGCLIDSVRPFLILPPRNPGLRDTFICSPPPIGPSIRTEDGTTWSEDACGELIEFQDKVFGCDTSYHLNLRYFKYTKDWQLNCGNCQGFVEACPNIEYNPDCPEFNDGSVVISLEWVDGITGAVLGTTPNTGCWEIKEPGRYCVNITVSFRGAPCMESWQECIDVDETFFPKPLPIDGDTSVCGTEPGKYWIELPPNACEFFWTIKLGGGMIITPNSQDTNAIEVDWSSRTGPDGLVCVQYSNDCGLSEDTCFMVDFEGAPIINAGPDTNICASSYTMRGLRDLGGMWTQVSGPGSANIVNPSDINTDVNITTYGEYKFIYSESDGECSSVDSVTIGFRPDPEMTDLDTICALDAESFIVEFDLTTGTTPYIIVSGGGSIDGSGHYTSDTIFDNTATTIVIRDSFGCELIYFIDYDCDCGNAIGEIRKDTLKFCGPNDQACAQYDATNQKLAPGLDTAIFVLYTTLGQLQTTMISSNYTGCFNFDPGTMNMDQVYYIGVVVGRKDANGSVDFDAGCLILEEAQPVIWFTIPSPNAGIDVAVCGLTFDLQSIPSIGSYRWLNTPGVTFNDQTILDPTISILPGAYGTYTLVFEETNGSCTTTDTIDVTFNEIPQAVNPDEICLNRVTFEFKVCFEVTGGTPPYTIVQGGGTYDPNTGMYCTDTLPNLTTYDIIIRDANGCEFRITGDHNCDCGPSDPGTMDPDPIETCIDKCVDISTNGSEVLQADEEAVFVLHEGSGALIVNELERHSYDHTANPPEVIQFCFDANLGMIPGRVYYVSRIIHETGNPDDDCERIAQGTPIIWNAYPTADAGTDQDICGLMADIAASPSIGIGEWTLESRPAGSNFAFTSSLSAQTVTVDIYGSYTFRWKEDNTGCSDSASITITFHDAPLMTNLQVECDENAENYRLVFGLTGGDATTYSVTGIPTTVTSGIYTTDWINSGDNVSLCATDTWDCLPACLDTTIVCQCLTVAGNVSSDDILCLDDCLTANYNGGNLDGNDVVRFYLHNGDANNIGVTVYECNESGDFCFDASQMTPNTTYYITVVVGNIDPSTGCVSFTDRCVQETSGVPVTWYDYPEAQIDGATLFTCDIDSLLLDGSNSSAPVGNGLTYEWTTIGGSLCGNSTSNNAWICSSGEYILEVTDVVSGCVSRDTIVIDRDDDIPIAVAGGSLLITCDNPIATLDGTGSETGTTIGYEWLDANDVVVSTDLITQVTMPGTYRLRVINSANSCDETVSVTVREDRERPTANIDLEGKLSCISNEADLAGINSITKGGVRSYTWSTSNGTINGPSDGERINITSPGTYQLIIIDNTNGCADTVTIDVVEEDNTLETINYDAEDPSCFGDNNGRIEVESISGGVPPFMYSIDNGPFGNSTLFSGLSPGTYNITVRDANGCEKDTVITIIEPVELGVSTKPDQFKEAGDDIDIDTLLDQIVGTTRSDADSIIWIDDETGGKGNTDLY